jgi:Ca2+-transporting ATPase
MEGKDPGIMKRKPRNPKDAIVNRRVMKSVIIRAIFICISAFGAFLYGFFIANVPDGIDRHLLAMSMCFFTLVASELLVVYPSKSDTFIGMSTRLFGNKFLNLATLAALAVLVAVMYIPVLGDLFSVIPLGATEMTICILLVITAIVGFEISKLNSGR